MATEFQFKITGETYHFEKQSVCCHSKGPNLIVFVWGGGLYGKQSKNLELRNHTSSYLKTKQTKENLGEITDCRSFHVHTDFESS